MKLEQAARQVVDAWDLGEFSTRMDETITALREALAEPNCQCGDKCFPIFSGDIEYCDTCRKPTALAEQAEQEPVCIDWDTKTDEPIMGYAAPVRTKDLTDDEILEAVGITDPQGCIKHSEFIGDARAVIAADREKNK